MDFDTKLQSWKMTYEQLLIIADQQLQLLSGQTDDLSPLADLAVEWQKWQAQSDQIALQLKETGETGRMATFFEQDIRPIAEQMKKVLEEAEKRLKSQVGTMGEVIKDTKDRRLLMNAYYGMNQNDGIAYYVDEKK